MTQETDQEAEARPEITMTINDEIGVIVEIGNEEEIEGRADRNMLA